MDNVNEICAMLDILLKSIKPCLNNEKLTILEDIKPSSAEFVIKSAINSLYGISVEKQIANDPANFCGNCLYYRDRGTYAVCAALCSGKFVIDPDQSSCECFEHPSPDKPMQEVCEHCSGIGCAQCSLCPF